MPLPHPVTRSRLILSLALSLLTTLSIAWLSAAFLPLSTFRGTQLFDPDGHAPIATLATAASLTAQRWRLTRDAQAFVPEPHATDAAARNRDAAAYILRHCPTPPAWCRVPRPEDAEPLALGDVKWTQDARGFPFLALRCEWRGDGTPAKPSTPRGGIALAPTPRNPWRALPCIPIWPGLLANLITYTLLSLALLSAPTFIRTRLRQRRNECPVCGYPRTGLAPSSPCPECGRTS